MATSQSLNVQLHNASATGDVQTLKALVQQVQASNPENWQDQLYTCFQMPSQCSGDNAPDWCSVYTPFSKHTDDCLSVLHTAAVAWQPESVKFLTVTGQMPVDNLDEANQTALHAAFGSFIVYWDPCTESFRETVLALLAAGTMPLLLQFEPFENSCVNFADLDRASYGQSVKLLKGAQVQTLICPSITLVFPTTLSCISNLMMATGEQQY